MGESMRLYTVDMALQLEAAGVLPSVPWTVFAMRAVGVSDGGHSMELEPWDETVAVALEAWRERVSACTRGTLRPIVRSVAAWKAAKKKKEKTKSYRFHMTYAYNTRRKGNEAEMAKQRLIAYGNHMCKSLGPVMCRAPHLCYFNSMAAYHPVELGGGGGLGGPPPPPHPHRGGGLGAEDV
jgi:hypothetical protein